MDYFINRLIENQAASSLSAHTAIHLTCRYSVKNEEGLGKGLCVLETSLSEGCQTLVLPIYM